MKRNYTLFYTVRTTLQVLSALLVATPFFFLLAGYTMDIAKIVIGPIGGGVGFLMTTLLRHPIIIDRKHNTFLFVNDSHED